MGRVELIKFDEPWGKYAKRRPKAAQAFDIALKRMVGVTGIEPVTPTMSTLFPCMKPRHLWERSAKYLVVFGM
jgi:hypothetical protein